MEEQKMDFLNKLYQNTRMGEELIGTILNSVSYEPLKQDLITQMQGYSKLSQKARKQMESAGYTPQQVSPMTRLMSGSSAKMQAWMDGSPSHIAEMMIQGSTMGIIEATEQKNSFPESGGAIQKLATDVIHFEQNNIERMKSYL